MARMLRLSHRATFALGLIVVAAPFAIFALRFVILEGIAQSQNWPAHIFQLSVTPPYLSEETAKVYAIKALAIDGFSAPDLWYQRNETKDPHGRIDQCFARDPSGNSGIFQVRYNKMGNFIIRESLTEKRLRVQVQKDL
jgi:hypothetical protein